VAGIDRRGFLRLSVAAAATPLTARAAWAGRPQAAGNPVVIVGAGLAGLHAASLLRKSGRPVVVLEARAEPGGRVSTIRDPFGDGQFGEAGAIRISEGHRRVLGLVKEHGLSVVPFYSSNGAELMTIGGTNVRADALKSTPLPLDLRPEERGLTQAALLERYVGPLPADLADLSPSAASYARWIDYDKVTWTDWLRARGASADAVKLMTLGGDSRALSALYVLRQYALLRGKTQFYKIQGGMDRLPQAMAAALGDAVHYDASVVSIDQTGDPVWVEYMEQGEPKRVAANRVIVTVPLPLLRDVDIYPELAADRQRTIAELPYFEATRILVQTYSRFWHDTGLSGYARTDQPAEVWDATYDMPGRAGILGATVGGEIGHRLLPVSPDVAVSRGRDIVGVPFPKALTSTQTVVAHRWALEPWSKGAFAVFHPGQMTAMMPAIAKPEGRLHFAGEHTSSWMGWMEGALESGERAAREVMS
jgi:monoamine oxidase